MAFTRRFARPLLSSIFVVGGLDALRHPAGKAQKASAVTEPLRENVPATAGLDTETLVRINGGVQVVAGVLLATGRFRRTASLVLMGSLVPTTYAGHRFWEETDSVARAQQKMHFVKNLGLLGGLILAAVDTEGEPSLSWRARRKVQTLDLGRGLKHSENGSVDLGSMSKAAVASVSSIAEAASKSGTQSARRAHRTSRRAARRVMDTGLDVAHRAADAREGVRDAQGTMVETIRGSGGSAAHALQQTGAALASAARQLEPLAESAVHAGAERAERAGESLAKVADRLPTS
jgi:uncharacterized membrane protein YphA (DoxX/SURF4 family)